MALLQIAEPGESPAPHQRRLAIGIDLGTTNSLVASVRSGVAEVLADESGADILPSIVRYFPGGDVIVGAEAKVAAAEDPENTIASVKRFMGRGLDDIRRDNLRLPYEFIEYDATESSVPRLSAAGSAVTAVEVSAQILKVLRSRATDALGGEPVGAVITVPAYFDDAQRQATKDAATLAGLNVLRLLNEPTAAAIAYGLDNADQGIIAVYDLGGGTFDISILSLEQGVFQVLATGGDTALGGDDFDALIVDWILQQANVDSIASLDKTVIRQLLDKAVAAKEALTADDVAALDVDLGSRRWQGQLNREIFNVLIEPLVKRTLQACRRVLQDADLKTDAIGEVVMVGGSTRVPYVQDAVSNFFGRRVLTDIDPDRVVALGAAIQADILAGNKRDSDILLLDVIPLSLGIETMGGLVEKIIPRNSTIPVARAQEFTTFKDGQTAMSVHVVQGERELVSDCRSLAKFELHGIPPMAAGAARIRVTFQVDADGLLNVSARDLTSGKSAGIQVKPSFGLSDSEITKMLHDSILHAENDLQQRRVKERQVEANRMLESIDAALRKDADELLTDAEKNHIQQARDVLAAARNSDDPDVIKHAIEQLEAASAEYVSRRMDTSVRKLMRGHVIDEYSS